MKFAAGVTLVVTIVLWLILLFLFSALISCSNPPPRRVVVGVSGVEFLYKAAYGEYELVRIEALSPGKRDRIYKPPEVTGELRIGRDDMLYWKYTEGLLERTIVGPFEVHAGILVIFTDDDHIFAALNYRFASNTMYLTYWNIQSKRELTFVYTKVNGH